MASEPTYWFPAKRYGWGWGPPTRWQGWAVLALHFAVVFGGIPLVPAKTAPLTYLALVLVATAVLIAVCAFKGEPPRWRWGNDGTDKR